MKKRMDSGGEKKQKVRLVVWEIFLEARAALGAAIK